MLIGDTDYPDERFNVVRRRTGLDGLLFRLRSARLSMMDDPRGTCSSCAYYGKEDNRTPVISAGNLQVWATARSCDCPFGECLRIHVFPWTTRCRFHEYSRDFVRENPDAEHI
jgi:hypothetical protein